MIHIETERLLLRDIEPDDEWGLFEMDSDPEVHRFLGNKPVRDIEDCRKAIAFIRWQYETYGIGRWAVIEKATGMFTGWSGLKLITDTINDHTQYYDVGYRFNRRFWGRGYATETAIAAVDYGRRSFGEANIFGMAEEGHKLSRNVLQKAGLSFDGLFEHEERSCAWYRLSPPDGTPDS